MNVTIFIRPDQLGKFPQVLQTTPIEGLLRKMKDWRNGFGPIPKEYVAGNKQLAEASLELLKAQFGIKVHGTPELVSAGDFDGMRVLQAVVETRKGRLIKLKWHDENTTVEGGCQGIFFVCSQGHGGSSRLFATDLE